MKLKDLCIGFGCLFMFIGVYFSAFPIVIGALRGLIIGLLIAGLIQLDRIYNLLKSNLDEKPL